MLVVVGFADANVHLVAQVFEALIERATKLMQAEQNVVDVSPKNEETVSSMPPKTLNADNAPISSAVQFSVQIAPKRVYPLHSQRCKSSWHSYVLR